MGGRQLLYDLFFSKRPSVQASKRPSVQASKRPSVQASKRPSVQASKRPSVQASKRPSVLRRKPTFSFNNARGFSILGIIVAAGMMGGLARAAGPCSNYPSSCSPPCDEYCTYYTFSPGSITKTIKQIPFELSVFRPGELTVI